MFVKNVGTKKCTHQIQNTLRQSYQMGLTIQTQYVRNVGKHLFEQTVVCSFQLVEGELKMKTLGEFVGITIATILIFFVMILMRPLFGMAAGWIVGFVLPATMSSAMNALSIHNLSMADLGAFLGFVSGFFMNTTKTVTKE